MTVFVLLLPHWLALKLCILFICVLCFGIWTEKIKCRQAVVLVSDFARDKVRMSLTPVLWWIAFFTAPACIRSLQDTATLVRKKGILTKLWNLDQRLEL